MHIRLSGGLPAKNATLSGNAHNAGACASVYIGVNNISQTKGELVMKPRRITWIAVALLAALLAGCGAAEPTNPQTEPPVSTGAPTETPT